MISRKDSALKMKNKLFVTQGMSKIDEKIVISGREVGQKQRKILKLDQRDEDGNDYIMIFPENIVAIATSFFLGVFGKSVRKLGRDKFTLKYEFQCSETVRKNIIDGVYDALNDVNFTDFK